MKKGIIAGISVVAISAAFWACGSGSVEDLNAGDENALGLYGFDPEAMVGKKAEALKACEDDAACVAKQTGAEPIDVGDEDDEGGSEDESSESSEPVSSDSKAATSSNSAAVTSSAGGSTGGTSSATVTGNSSASVTGNSSAVITPVGKSSSSTATSSAAASGTGAVKGVCSTTSPIEKGGTATWKFTRMSGAAVETYNWTLNGAATTSSTDASPSATYKNAGEFTAKVVVNKGTESESEITCGTKLKVNGAAISGCKCTPNVTVVDLADKNPSSVTWTVSGCTSADGSTTFTYAWKDGSTAVNTSGDAFTKSFTETAKSYAPTVTVSNSDKMAMSPTCTAAKIDDSAAPLCEELSYEIDQWNSNKTVAGTFTDGCWEINTAKACSKAQVQAEGTGSYTINGESRNCSYTDKALETVKSVISLEVPEGCTVKQLYLSGCS